MVVGRIGVHSSPDEEGLGSNAENLLRLCPSDMLFSTALEHPELDVKAEESIHWTPEAEKRMERVPDLVRNIARTGILRLAVEQGHSVITNSLVTEAMERFMPKRTSMTTTALAEALAIQQARQQPAAMCRKCGVTSKVPDPVKCSVCGGTDFEVITPEMLDRIASMEGGVEEETTYDGRKLKWTRESRRALYAVTDKYQMRRSKARIEKKARSSRLETITLEFAKSVIDEETGAALLPADAVKSAPASPDPQPAPQPEAQPTDPRPVVATDPKGIELRSIYGWTDEAIERVLRVPSGFMRNSTQQRIEDLAAKRSVQQIDLALVGDGIEVGKQMMAEMLGQAGMPQPELQPKAEAKCPFSGVPNEAGWMSEMIKKRKEILE